MIYPRPPSAFVSKVFEVGARRVQSYLLRKYDWSPGRGCVLCLIYPLADFHMDPESHRAVVVFEGSSPHHGVVCK